MGDRGNIRVVERHKDGGQIYFYTHWTGGRLRQVLRHALERGRGRWDDPPYLNRIIFCEMIMDDVDGETGFGISTYECDNDVGNPIITVDHDRKVVSVGRREWTFDEYARRGDQ